MAESNPATPAAAPVQGQPMLDPQGQVVPVHPDSVQAAQAQGYLPLSPEDAAKIVQQQQFGGVGGAAKAFGLGAARGLTFGASDLAFDATGAVPGATLKGYAEANPLASGAGHLAGAVAPLLATGGEAAALEGAEGAGAAARAAEAGGGALSALGRAAGAPVRGVSALGDAAASVARGVAGEGLAGDALAGAARGAAEMPFYSAGDQLTEDVFDNKPLTAESLLAAAGRGAIIGGFTGGALEGALGLAGEYLPRAFKRTSDAFDQLEKRLAPAEEAPIIPGVEVPAGPKTVPVADSEGAQRAFGTHLSNSYEGTERHLSEFFQKEKPARVEAMLGDSDQAGKAAESLMQDARAGLNAAKDGSTSLNKAQDIIDEVAGKVSAAKNDAERFTAIDQGKRAIDRLARFDRDLRPEQLEALQPVREAVGRWRSALEDPKVFGPEAATFQKDTNAAISRYFDAREGFQKAFTRRGATDTEGARAIDSAKVERFVKARTLGKAANDDRELFLKNYVSAGKDLLGTLEQTTYRNLPGGAQKASEVRSLLDAASSKGDAAAQAIRERQAAEAANKAAPRQYAQQVRAAERQSGQLLKEQAKAAADHGSSLALDLAEHLPGVGHVVHFARNTEVLAKVASTAAKVSEKVGLGLEAALSRRGGRAVDAAAPAAAAALTSTGRAAPGETRLEAYRRRLAELDRHPEEKAGALAEATSSLHPHAPQLSGQLQQSMVSREQYLAQAAPRDPVPSTGLPARRPYAPSPTELAKFERVHRAVTHPLSVIDDLRDGRVTPEAVAAVKATSPALYGDMVRQLGQRMSELREPLGYDQMLQVSIFLGSPVDYTQQMAARTQAVFSVHTPNGPDDHGPQRPRASGLAHIHQAERSASSFSRGENP